MDIDGVVIDTPHERAWREALAARHPGAVLTPAEYAALVAGKPRLAGARAALAAHGIAAKAEVEAYAAAKQALFLDLVAQGVFTVFADAVRFIAAARAAGLRIAAASSSKNTTAMLARANLAALFHADLSGRDVPRGKPAPDLFLLAAAELGVPPARCLVLEDAPAGIEAAHAAGMASLAVARQDGADALRAAGATLVVTTLDAPEAHSLRSTAKALAMLRAERPAAYAGLAARLGLSDSEPADWMRAADAIVIPHDPETGLIEQFRGFFGLHRVDLRGMHGAEAAALVRGRAQHTQISKQVDVVALLALLPDGFPPETVRASYAYYEPLSTHESSLSAALHAVVAARLGHTAQALRHFRQAYALDTGATPGSSAGGVHIAALGGVWQAAILGFAGVSWGTGTLRLAPRLRDGGQGQAFALHWRGSHLRVRLDAAQATLAVEGGPSIDLEVYGVPVHVSTGGSVSVGLCQ